MPATWSIVQKVYLVHSSTGSFHMYRTGWSKLETHMLAKKLKNIRGTRDLHGLAAASVEGVRASPQGAKKPFLFCSGGPAWGLSIPFRNPSLSSSFYVLPCFSLCVLHAYLSRVLPIFLLKLGAGRRTGSCLILVRRLCLEPGF